jgi:hypothetical protein
MSCWTDVVAVRVLLFLTRLSGIKLNANRKSVI